MFITKKKYIYIYVKDENIRGSEIHFILLNKKVKSFWCIKENLKHVFLIITIEEK